MAFSETPELSLVGVVGAEGRCGRVGRSRNDGLCRSGYGDWGRRMGGMTGSGYNSVEAVMGVWGVVHGADGAVWLYQGVLPFDHIAVAFLHLGLLVASVAVRNSIFELVFGIGLETKKVVIAEGEAVLLREWNQQTNSILFWSVELPKNFVERVNKFQVISVYNCVTRSGKWLAARKLKDGVLFLVKVKNKQLS